jgi:hypothetical protein
MDAVASALVYLVACGYQLRCLGGGRGYGKDYNRLEPDKGLNAGIMPGWA